ncbi:MAG: hypothetical protein IMZ61_14435 [Planctomycetes bacterium]|nr:hypothetical protein [Planctomycetota bacterium]
MNDREFIEFVKELLRAPDTVIKKAHMERMLSILAALEKGLRNVLYQGHNEDCLFCGFKDKIAQAALDGKEADTLGHSNGEPYDSRIEDR